VPVMTVGLVTQSWAWNTKPYSSALLADSTLELHAMRVMPQAAALAVSQ